MGREGGRSTTSKEEKNITRERKRRREKGGIRVDFSLSQGLVQAPPSSTLLSLPQKSMNEKKSYVGIAFFWVFLLFVAQFHHHLMTKKKQEKLT